MAFTSFGPDTHMELNHAWQITEPGTRHVIDFLKPDEHINELQAQGFEVLAQSSRTLAPKFSSVNELLNSIKRTGATNATESRKRGLLSKRIYHRFIDTLNQQTPLKLSYQALSFIAQKPFG